MASRMWRLAVGTALALGMLAALMVAPPAHADGLPILGIAGPSHPLRARDGTVTFQTRRAGRDTTVEAISKVGGGVLSVRLPGAYAVPVVAYDGTPAGLSANKRTLVLIRPRTRFPQAPTRLVILDARTLRTEHALRLPGDFSFDAISPDGRWIYLIQYTSRTDPSHYSVRALDSRSGRLLAGAIVDPHEPDEKMRGNPITRVTSADGRWAYTVYDGNGSPFVHALDTSGRQARCLDLPAFPANVSWWGTRLRFAPGGRQLLVTLGSRTLAVVSTATLTVSVPKRPATPSPQTRPSGHRSGGMLGIAFPVALAVLILGAALLTVRRRRAGLASNRSSRESALPH